jgi:hypothetical protein
VSNPSNAGKTSHVGQSRFGKNVNVSSLKQLEFRLRVSGNEKFFLQPILAIDGETRTLRLFQFGCLL